LSGSFSDVDCLGNESTEYKVE